MNNKLAALYGQYTIDGELVVACSQCNKLRTYGLVSLELIKREGEGDDFDEVVRNVLLATPHWFGQQHPLYTHEEK